MIRIDASKTIAGLTNLAAGITQAAELTLRAATQAAESSAKGTTRFKDRSGETRGTIKTEVNGLRGFVTAGGASGFLEWGTKPHTIVARNGTLRFEINGQAFYRRMVSHPGTAERPFMREARLRGEIAAEYGADYYLNYAIRKVRA